MSMAKVLVVTSGKGGVGKTTSTAALGAALAQAGQKVVVVDFDVGLRNLDLVLGVEHRVVHDLTDVVQDITKLPQSLIRDRRIGTLSLLPASQTRDKDALTEEGVGSVIVKLRDLFDWVICDSPAGIERGALFAMRFADAAVIVTNPEIASIRDSNRIIAMLDSHTQKAEKEGRLEKHLLITRYDAVRATRDEMLRIDDVLEILPIPLLGVIPESQEVVRASNVGSPVTLNNKRSAAARAYVAAAKKLKGNAAVIDMQGKKRLLHKWFGKKDSNVSCENLSSPLVARALA
jgi:septum site-determining protein MinD